MRDHQDDLDQAVAEIRSARDTYPDSSEVWIVLERLRTKVETLKDSGR